MNHPSQRLSGDRSNQSEPPQRQDAQRMAEIIPQLLARRGYARESSSERFLEAWQQVAGPFGRASRPGRVNRGVLEIVVSNSTVLQELTFQKHRLVRLMRDLLTEQRIHDLRFVVGTIDQST